MFITTVYVYSSRNGRRIRVSEIVCLGDTKRTGEHRRARPIVSHNDGENRYILKQQCVTKLIFCTIVVIHSPVITCPLTEGAFVKIIERSVHFGVLQFLSTIVMTVVKLNLEQNAALKSTNCQF